MIEQSPKSNFIKKIFFKQKISKPPIDVPSQTVQDLSDPTKQHDVLKRLLTKGTVFDKGRMSRILSEALATSYYRRTFYRECEQAASHSYVSAALDLYVDSVTAPSRITNKSIWVTSEDKKLENTLNQFLEEIALEERIRDWAGQLAMYGDFFIEPVGREGIGVAFVDDSIHPADMERIDINGRLEGFVRTGLYQNQATYTADVEAPWRYCFRGDVKVRLLDGTSVSFAEMAANKEKYVGKYCLSINTSTGQMEPDKIVDIRKTRENAELVRVHLDNEQYVDCTPDHLFMLRDGTYKEAGRLVQGDSLMPLYTRSSAKGIKGYPLVYDVARQRYRFLHRMVYEFFNGKCPSGHVIHHRRYWHEPYCSVGWNGFVSKTCPICGAYFDNIRVTAFANHIQQCRKRAEVLNHKVIKVEFLPDRDTVYDLETERNHNFPLDAGVFVHNCHFRIFGVTKKMLNTALGIFGEPGRMFSLEQERFKDKKFRYTTKYGVSLLAPAIPIYKRLKMAEDSLLMARITRGITYYLYKIKVSGGNIDSAAELVQSYSEYLKRQTGLDLTAGQEQWKDRWAPVFAQVEDLFVPESDDITVSHDQLGGDANIKAIVDIELLVNQLLGSLRVSKAMLGITDELPSAIGEGAAIRISINFAKNAYRLQTGIKQGIKRLCQIHLAYLNQNPDSTRFEINSGDISSAEEEELKNALDKGVDVVDKLAEMLLKFAPDIDRMELLNYLNQKFLRLDDLDISTMLGKGGELTAEAKQELKKRFERGRKVVAIESDCLSYLPGGQILRLNENNQVVKENRAWEPFKVRFTNNGGKGK